MKKYLIIFVALATLSFSASAQPSSQDYLNRLNILIKNLGPTGVGIETLLDRWAAEYPDDTDMLLGKFNYYYNKSQSSEVVKKDTQKYLGNAPFLSLKDSLGRPVNYFQVVNFNDSLFGIATSQMDRVIKKLPDRLDYRFIRISSLVAYEKDSPDMALSELRGLIDYNCQNNPQWEYPDVTVDETFFKSAIQEFCFAFFKIGSPACYSAFRDLSLKMLDYYPKDILFMDNMGSYYLVAEHNYKIALKYYNKVLKAKPDDITAIQNCILLARSESNVKLEKKYLPMFIKYSDDEVMKTSAKNRLEALEKKK